MTNNHEESRISFLIHMYDQMFNDINTHIIVIWQSAGVLVASFAMLALVEKAIISFDIALGLIILICGWLLSHIEDSSYWYNRNLIIIANIERQLLNVTDLHNIHYYFGKHREAGKMISHLRIQYAFGLGISIVMLLYHFFSRVLPGIGSPWNHLEPLRSIPYVIAISGIVFILFLRKRNKKKYLEFLSNSPGIEIRTDGITYGVGHPPYLSIPSTKENIETDPTKSIKENLV